VATTDKLIIRYSTPAPHILPPRRIRLDVGGWAGPADQKMEDGSEVQPWHCLPFVEGSTYGLELLYPHEQECRVINQGGAVRFDWDLDKEPPGTVTGGEFITFSPKASPGQYLFNTRMDLQAPPGHVLRIEPHPRFFTDLTGETPPAIIANVQSEWWSRPLFVVFKVPPPGGRHVFRKGEPYAQVIFVPQQPQYELEPMTDDQAAQRRQLSQSIERTKDRIATRKWINKAGDDQTNHYKVMAAAFAREGEQGVARVVQEAAAELEASLPTNHPTPDCMRLARGLMKEHRYDEARNIFVLVVGREPGNAEAVLNMGICTVCRGSTVPGLELMSRAVAMRPDSADFHAQLGEMRRLLGRLEEAEGSFRASLRLDPGQTWVLSSLALTLAQRGRPDEGLRICDDALATHPRDALLHLRKGLILAGLGRAEEARASYERVLAIDPAFPAAHQALRDLPISR
jgi:tetratricopeptide (TPR) repeat protein